MSELEGITCHRMGSHSVTCHMMQVNMSCLTSVRQDGTGEMEGWVDQRGWVHTEMLYWSANPSKYM